MNPINVTVLIVNLLSATFRCQECTEGVELINRVNDFYNFDHNIFFVDSLISSSCWLPMSSFIGKEFTPRTVYTFVDFSNTAMSECECEPQNNAKKCERVAQCFYRKVVESSAKITGAAALSAMSGKSTFLVVVTLKTKIDMELLNRIKTIRERNINVKIGVFFDRGITSLDTIAKLFRWCWNAGIVNIISAFHLNREDGGRSSFNVFKYDPFGTVHLINVTRSESLREYFSDRLPNYRKRPMQFVRVRELNASFSEIGYWNTVVDVFNASVFQLDIAHAEVGTKRASVGLLLHERHVTMSMPNLTYPHRQTTLVTIVPHAQPYHDFLAYLQNGTWTLLFAYTFLVIVLASLLLVVSGYLRKRKVSLFECVVNVVNLLINDNAAIKYRNLYRADIFIIIPLTFAGLIVMNGIVSIFQSIAKRRTICYKNLLSLNS